MLELRDVGHHRSLCYTDSFDKISNRFRRIAGSSQARQRWHSRVVPTAHVAVCYKRQELAFARQRVADVQPCKLNLPRA
jgi:hypothetical protein